MMRIKLLFIFIFVFYSCNNKQITDKKLLTVINNYIQSIPENYYFPRGASKKEYLYKNVPYPSISVFFNIKNKDTLVAIGYNPFYSKVNPFNNLLIPTDGFIIYNFNNKKYPIFFYNSDLFSGVNRKALIKEIPDSLKYDPTKAKFQFGNYKPNHTYYKINKGDFIKIKSYF